MRHTIHDLTRVSRLDYDEFKRYWATVGSESLHNASQYAMKLHNEATRQLSNLVRFRHNGGDMTPQLEEVEELFAKQRACAETFLNQARDTGLLREMKMPISKRKAKELIENITHGRRN